MGNVSIISFSQDLHVALDQLCSTQMGDRAKNYVIILTSPAHWMTY